MNYYVLTFDRALLGDYSKFHDEFVAHPEIHRWFHYVKSSYVVGTTLGAVELSKHYRQTAKKFGLPTRHFVVEIDLSNRHGWLPKEAWSWLNRNAPNKQY